MSSSGIFSKETYVTCSRNIKYYLPTNQDFTIGRALTNSLVLDIVKVSRKHCLIRKNRNSWEVKNMGLNGLKVNEVTIYPGTHTTLKDGDVMVLAEEFRLTFHNDKQTDALRNGPVVAQQPVFGQCPVLGQYPVVEQHPAVEQQPVVEQQPESSEIEEHLQCGICIELFINAHTLNCSHTFCKKCIGDWQQRRNYCPICRSRIGSCVPSIVINNIVESVVLKLPEAARESYRKAAAERAELEKNQPPKTLNRAVGQPSHTIVLSDDDDSSSSGSSGSGSASSDNDNDASGGPSRAAPPYEGVYVMNFAGHSGPAGSFVTPYYGGYGRCYRCGRRGHWSNGCPNRVV